MKKLIIVSAIGLCLNSLVLAQSKPEDLQDAQQYAERIDQVEVLFASRWQEVFKRLDPRNNISITLSMDDNMIEITNVFRLEAYSRFLILEARNEQGKNYKSIVYPSTILLIQEKGGSTLPAPPHR